MKTHVWPLVLRIFHWLLAIGFISAYVLGKADILKIYHVAFGNLVGSLIIMRLIYGLIGTKYALFKDFPIHIKSIVEYLKSILVKPKEYIGHNPIAALIMLAIFIVGLFTSISGILLYGNENLAIKVPLSEHTLEEIHEVFANLFFLFVLIHLVGLLFDWFIHRQIGTVFSMITGNKELKGNSVTLNTFQKIFAIAWIIVPIIVFFISFRLNE